MADKKISNRQARIDENRESKSMRTWFWGRDFINYFGDERQAYYKRKHDRPLMPMPRGLAVPTQYGIDVDEHGRVSVMVVDNPNITTISIPEAIERVYDLFSKGKK